MEMSLDQFYGNLPPCGADFYEAGMAERGDVKIDRAILSTGRPLFRTGV